MNIYLDKMNVLISIKSLIILQSSRPGRVKEYLEPSIIAATAATYPPFLKSGTVKPTFIFS